MNPPKKVSTASGRASGTPTIRARPDEEPVDQADEHLGPDEAAEGVPDPADTTLRWPPARGPAMRRTQGRNRSPSLTKRKASTTASRAVTTSEASVPTPVSTLEAMVVTLFCSRLVT